MQDLSVHLNKMVKKVTGNFKNKYKFNKIGLNCQNCSLSWKGKSEKRIIYEKMGDLVVYFRRYLTDGKKKEGGDGSFGGSAGLLDDYL